MNNHQQQRSETVAAVVLYMFCDNLYREWTDLLFLPVKRKKRGFHKKVKSVLRRSTRENLVGKERY